MTGESAARLLAGAVVALATAGAGGTAGLVLRLPLSPWLLPAALLAGVAAAGLCTPPAMAAPAAPPARGPRWPTWLAVLLVLLLAALLAHGALATGSRHWDGAVAWDLKARVLAASPTLEQPFFRDPAVYCHSRDYPLLQPLVMALLERAGAPGRLLFPAAFLLFAAAVGVSARAAGHGRHAPWFALAAACTPMVLAPTSGGFDSGYADGLLAAAVAATAAGLVAHWPVLVGAGAVVVTLQKPEGLPYAAMLVAACWPAAPRPVLVAAVLGTSLGGGLVLALQRDLASGGTANSLAPLGLAAAAATLLLLADGWLRRRQATPRRRALALAALLPAAALLLAWLPETGSLGSHLDAARGRSRLGDLPAVLLTIAQWALASGRYGLTFVLPLLLLAAARRQGRPPPTALGAWLVLAVPVLCAPFLLSPIDDLPHHLRSALPRLLLHWTGAVWVWIAWRAPTAAGAGPRVPVA